jgi:hypothetical protein
MTTSILVPFRTGDCPHRDAAWGHVRRRYESWPIHVGSCAGEWSKGSALAAARAGTSADVLVLADADSFVDADTLRAAINLVESRAVGWVVPHRTVYRLNQKETSRVLAGAQPRLGATIRAPYPAVAGGGITVVAASAFDDVRGVDDRYLGWGGEDLSFGWALETLAGQPARLDAPLVHLWHPHPAPNLRGSPEAEELVARYRHARGVPRLMQALVDRVDPAPAEIPERPVRFATARESRTVKVGDRVIRFRRHVYETRDPDEIELLRWLPDASEVS